MVEHQPPKWAQKLLLFFLKEELVEEVLGDLDEKFYSQLDKYTLQKARRNYWYQVLNYMRPFAIKFFNSPSMIYDMVKHNFLISSRILWKDKVSSVINIGGLAIGFTVVLLIGLWIRDEFTFNQYHENHGKIVQVLRKNVRQGEIHVNSSLPGQLGLYLQNNFPDIFEEVIMTFFRREEELLLIDEQSYETTGYFFHGNAPQMLSFRILEGSNSFENRNGILLSKSMAQKCFGDQNPIGQTVRFNARNELTVSGVFQDLPQNSTFSDAHFIVSMGLVYSDQNPYVWDNYNINIYAQLQPEIQNDQAGRAIQKVLAQNLEENNRTIDLLLLPMKDWHLNSHFENGVQVKSDQMRMISNIALIGLFVLLLACINFINLNTARFQNRAREVGVKKTLGSLRSQLVAQFLLESFLYAFLAFILSIILVNISLPWFNDVSAKTIRFPWINGWFWLISLGATFMTAILAGSHPAIFLSSFNPIGALKGNLSRGKSGARFRQGLVIFQFTISIILTIGTIAIYQQIQYAKDRPKGYEQDRLLTLKGLSEEYYQKYDLLRAELKRTGVVEEIAEANYPLTTTLGNNDGFRTPEMDTEFNISFNTIFVTPEYGAATQWELVQGRDFSRELGDEFNSIIISESAAKGMELSNPIGQQILSSGFYNYSGQQSFKVIGVVKDMIKGSPYDDPRPLIVFPTTQALRYLFIRIKEGIAFNKAIPKIKEAYNNVLPKNPFNYQFVDNQYLNKFRAEEKMASLASMFTIIALLISALGLFGLSAFIAEKRTKEIGIRKVLGASVFNLWQLLSKDFGLLVLLAFLIALPISIYFLQTWLNDYEYQVPMYWWIYALGGICCLMVTLITVSYHSIKAARSNPIQSLQTE